MVLEKIEVEDGKYCLNFRVSDSKHEVVDITSDGLEKMLILLKQAKMANSGQVLEAEAKVKLDIETLDNKMTELRKEFSQEFQRKATDVKTDIDYMKSVVGKIESERENILHQINVEIKRQLDNITLILSKVKEVEEQAFKNVCDREEIIENIVEDIKSKNDLSWDSIHDIKKEVLRDKSNYENIKKTLETSLSSIDELLNNKKKEMSNVLAELKNNADNFIEDNTNKVKELADNTQKTVGVIYDKVSEIQKAELKEKYLQSELKRREDINSKKAEYIKEKCENEIKKIEILRSFFDTESQAVLIQIKNSFENAIEATKNKPSYLEVELKKINGYLDEFKTKNSEAKKNKDERLKKSIVNLQKVIENDNLLGTIKDKKKDNFKK